MVALETKKTVTFTPKVTVRRMTWTDQQDGIPKPVQIVVEGFSFASESEDFDGKVPVCTVFGVKKWVMLNDNEDGVVEFTMRPDNDIVVLNEREIFDCLIACSGVLSHGTPILHTANTFIKAFVKMCKWCVDHGSPEYDIPTAEVRTFYEHLKRRDGKVLVLIENDTLYDLVKFSQARTARVSQATQ